MTFISLNVSDVIPCGCGDVYDDCETQLALNMVNVIDLWMHSKVWAESKPFSRVPFPLCEETHCCTQPQIIRS